HTAPGHERGTTRSAGGGIGRPVAVMAGQTELLGNDVRYIGIGQLAGWSSRTGCIRHRELCEGKCPAAYVRNRCFTGAIGVTQVYLAIHMQARCTLCCKVTLKMADYAVGIRHCP